MLLNVCIVLVSILVSCKAKENVLTFEKDYDQSKFSFASFYQDNMVLQMEPVSAILWGFGTVGATVNITVGETTQSTRVVSHSKDVGVWKAVLAPQPAGGPHTVTATHDHNKTISKLQLSNILFGDVWICSGQSNMQFTVSQVFNATEELNSASQYKDIRVMTPSQIESTTPLLDFKSIEQQWSLPSADSLGGPKLWTYFSAVCWFYGKYLYENLKVPIGLVSPNWGGTPVEAWSSPKALQSCGLESPTSFVYKNSLLGPNINSVLWNAMIHPILNMTIKGAIWYQGESNQGYHNKRYSCSFPSMIKDWRESWFEGTGGQTHSQFPFGFVQLSTRHGKDFGEFASIRWHQTGDYGYVPNPKMPNTFMAVAMDLPDPSSPYTEIHPRDKQDVGVRLGMGGLKVAYGKHVNPNGPFPEKAVRTGDGYVVVTYPNEQRLSVTEQGNFQICCNYTLCDFEDPSPSPDWFWAPITSHTHRTITLHAKICLSNAGLPVLVRYAWQLVPCSFKNCSVYNDIGLPGPPFVLSITDF